MSVEIKDFLLKSTLEKIPLASGNKLNDKYWQVAGIPMAEGKYFMYEDEAAIINIEGDNIEVDIPKFTHSHDQVQIFDNPKQLYLTKAGFEPGTEGAVAFSCKMKARIDRNNPQDFRDGFCAFNVLDFATGMVFDIVSNGAQIWAIFERLFIPGLVEEQQAFTKVINIDHSTSPADKLECTILYNQKADQTSFYVGNKLIYEANQIPVKIERLFMGFGLITLHPIVEGKSVSCRGQGGLGVWSDFTVRRM